MSPTLMPARISCVHFQKCWHCGPPMLDLHRAKDSIDGARKFDQQAITCGFDDAATMLSDPGINERLAHSFERGEGSFLVSAHQSAVAGDVGREDGSQPPFDPRFGHKGRPRSAVISSRVYGRWWDVCLKRGLFRVIFDRSSRFYIIPDRAELISLESGG